MTDAAIPANTDENPFEGQTDEFIQFMLTTRQDDNGGFDIALADVGRKLAAVGYGIIGFVSLPPVAVPNPVTQKPAVTLVTQVLAHRTQTADDQIASDVAYLATLIDEGLATPDDHERIARIVQRWGADS